MKFSTVSAFGTDLSSATHDRRQALVERGRKLYFLVANLGCDRLRADDEHHGVGTREQALDPPPPVLERIDVGPIDQRLEPASLERCLKAIREGHVLARIGNEHLGF